MYCYEFVRVQNVPKTEYKGGIKAKRQYLNQLLVQIKPLQASYNSVQVSMNMPQVNIAAMYGIPISCHYLLQEESDEGHTLSNLRDISIEIGQRFFFVGPSGRGKTWRICEMTAYAKMAIPGLYVIVISPTFEHDKTWEQMSAEWERHRHTPFVDQFYTSYSENVRHFLAALVTTEHETATLIILEDLTGDHNVQYLKVENPVNMLCQQARQCNLIFFMSFWEQSKVPKILLQNYEYAFEQAPDNSEEIKLIKKQMLSLVAPDVQNRIMSQAFAEEFDSLFVERQRFRSLYYRVHGEDGEMTPIRTGKPVDFSILTWRHYLHRTILTAYGHDRLLETDTPGNFSVSFDQRYNNVTGARLVACNLPRTYQQVGPYTSEFAIQCVDAPVHICKMKYGTYSISNFAIEMRSSIRAALSGEVDDYKINVVVVGSPGYLSVRIKGVSFTLLNVGSQWGWQNIAGMDFKDIPSVTNGNISYYYADLSRDFNVGANLETLYIQCEELWEGGYSANSGHLLSGVIAQIAVKPPRNSQDVTVNYAPTTSALYSFQYSPSKYIDSLRFKTFAHISGPWGMPGNDIEIDFQGAWPNFQIEIDHH